MFPRCRVALEIHRLHDFGGLPQKDLENIPQDRRRQYGFRGMGSEQPKMPRIHALQIQDRIHDPTVLVEHVSFSLGRGLAIDMAAKRLDLLLPERSLSIANLRSEHGFDDDVAVFGVVGPQFLWIACRKSRGRVFGRRFRHMNRKPARRG